MKKIISFIISFSLVFGAVAPCFAIDLATPSSISLKSVSLLSDTKATTSATTVEPDDSQATRYYVNSNGSITSSSTWINTWGNIVTDITYSLAYSADIIENRLLTLINNLSSYLYSSSTTGYYLWDWSSSNGPYQGSPTGTQSVISQLRAMGSSITKILSYNTEYSYQLYDYLVNGSGLTVNLASPWHPYFMPSDSYDFTSDEWRYWSNYRVNLNGNLSSVDTYNTNFLIPFKESIRNGMNSISVLTSYLTGSVRYTYGANLELYDSDLNKTIVSDNLNNLHSVWYDLRKFASNTSFHLSRLAFVLASDEEIEARRAASDNQTSALDNFVKPSGSGSASTSDLSDMAGISSGVQNILSTGVSPSSAFSSMSSNSSAWEWFTNDTKNALDTSTSSRSFKQSSGFDTPYLDDYNSSLEQALRGFKRD